VPASSASSASFDELVAEAEAAPIRGWDFGWLAGRATEERPSWRYAERVAERAAGAERMLDLECGDGRLLAGLPAWPRLVVGAEGHPPNAVLAARRLGARGGHVVRIGQAVQALPFRPGAFDLVTSRHPVTTWWGEIARVLTAGGTYFSQQVGPHSVGELIEFMLGPQPRASARDPDRARREAEAAGLVVHDLRTEQLRTVFHDVGAVVYFLRLVVWIVPGFTVDRFRDRLLALHDEIGRHGPFVAHATRFLIEARRPG
jgi:SAM-dependent methyltransferase